VAYGIYEEGIMVQSFFDPTWIDLGTLAVCGSVGGNWVWAEHLTLYHALISITVGPVLTGEILRTGPICWRNMLSGRLYFWVAEKEYVL
jgi:hypothetical protein